MYPPGSKTLDPEFEFVDPKDENLSSDDFPGKIPEPFMLMFEPEFEIEFVGSRLTAYPFVRPIDPDPDPDPDPGLIKEPGFEPGPKPYPPVEVEVEVEVGLKAYPCPCPCR